MPKNIIISFNKHYIKKEQINFPDSFELESKDKLIKYELKGQIEHAGSTGGGHYWAKGIRRSDSVNTAYIFNDMSVQNGILGPNRNVFMVLYEN